MSLRGLMRTRYWVLIILAATSIHFCLVFGYLDLQIHPVMSRIALAVHVVACIGPFWMLADWFLKKHKRSLEGWMWLFLVPWGFLWYYFEIDRPMRAHEGWPR